MNVDLAQSVCVHEASFTVSSFNVTLSFVFDQSIAGIPVFEKMTRSQFNTLDCTGPELMCHCPMSMSSSYKTR